MEREAEKIREEMCTVREVKCTCVCVRVCMWEIAWRGRKSERGGVKRVEVENGESNQSISATRKCAKCKNERIALLIYVRRTLCSNRIFSTVRPRRAIDQSRRGDLERTCEMDRTFVASGYMLRRSRNTSKLRCILTLKNLSVRAIRLGFIKKKRWKKFPLSCSLSIYHTSRFRLDGCFLCEEIKKRNEPDGVVAEKGSGK